MCVLRYMVWHTPCLGCTAAAWLTPYCRRACRRGGDCLQCICMQQGLRSLPAVARSLHTLSPPKRPLLSPMLTHMCSHASISLPVVAHAS